MWWLGETILQYVRTLSASEDFGTEAPPKRQAVSDVVSEARKSQYYTCRWFFPSSKPPELSPISIRFPNFHRSIGTPRGLPCSLKSANKNSCVYFNGRFQWFELVIATTETRLRRFRSRSPNVLQFSWKLNIIWKRLLSTESYRISIFSMGLGNL